MASEEQAVAKNVGREVGIDFLSGVVGGIACAYTGQPLDTVKVKMQTYPHLYRNTWRCLTDTVRNEGFLRLYAGAVPAAAANVGESAVLFLCYGQCTKVVASLFGIQRSEMTTVHKALSGSFASFFAAFALCPLELIKCRMQTLGEFKGSIHNITPLTVIKDTLRKEGILGFYNGMTSTMLREMPGYFFFFGAYEGTKTAFERYDTEHKVPDLARTIIAGGNGGVAIWSAIYPFDVIKSRMQVTSQGDNKMGFIQCVRALAREEGIRSFYKGLTPTLLRAFPSCAALFIGVEHSKKFFNYAF